MKLNLILLVLLASLLGATYFIFEKNEQADLFIERRAQYLVPIDTLESWTLETQNGKLSLKDRHFYWNDTIEVNPKDTDFIEIYTRLRDLKVVDAIDNKGQNSWDKSKETGVTFTFQSNILKNKRPRSFRIGALNALTGRMKVLDVESNTVFFIDDESTLKNPYKSFEIGQRIKYAKLLQALKQAKWK